MVRFVLACALVACGRIGFDASAPVPNTDGVLADGAIGDGMLADSGASDGSHAASTSISYVGPIAERYPGQGGSDTFTLQATNAGDAVLVMVGCAGATTPTSVTFDATGWTLVTLSPMTIDTAGQVYGASFGAIAPDTSPATATVTWAGANCNRGKTELADEFAGNDTTSASAAFDAHAEVPSAGNPAVMITTGHANDAVWGAIYSATMATAIGSGYEAGATDGNGDFAEYLLTSAPAGTVETVTFTNPNSYVVVAATIVPAP